MTDRKWEESLLKIVNDLKVYEQESRPPEMTATSNFQGNSCIKTKHFSFLVIKFIHLIFL